MKLETVDVEGGADIISVYSNSIGTIFAVGLGDGRIAIYQFNTLIKMNQFEPFEREGGKI